MYNLYGVFHQLWHIFGVLMPKLGEKSPFFITKFFVSDFWIQFSHPEGWPKVSEGYNSQYYYTKVQKNPMSPTKIQILGFYGAMSDIEPITKWLGFSHFFFYFSISFILNHIKFFSKVQRKSWSVYHTYKQL